MKSPIPWMGSKRRMARKLLESLPEHTTFVEVFAGSAALLFAREEPAEVEVINDIDGELVNFFRVLKHHLGEFCQQFRWAVTSRKMWDWAKDTPTEVLTDIQRAARFYYLQRLCFGGKPHGRTFGYALTAKPRLNLVRIEEELSEVHARLARVLVENLDWQECLRRYDRPATLFFLDPPYLATAQYGSKWGVEQFEELAETLAGIHGRGILTLNDHPEVRRIFGRWPATQTEVTYTVGGGRRASRCAELVFRIGPDWRAV